MEHAQYTESVATHTHSSLYPPPFSPASVSSTTEAGAEGVAQTGFMQSGTAPVVGNAQLSSAGSCHPSTSSPLSPDDSAPSSPADVYERGRVHSQVIAELTGRSSPYHRHFSRSPLLPPDRSAPSTTNAEISSFLNNYQYTSSQDVLPNHLSADCPPAPGPSSTRQNGYYTNRPLESQQLSSFNSHHVSLTTPSPSLRTPQAVFHTTSALASHHGIPTRLPPVPTTKPRHHQSDNLNTTLDSSDSHPAFHSLLTSYLDMLKDKPEEQQNQVAQEMEFSESAPVVDGGQDASAAQAILDILQGSPSEFASPEFGMYDDFLTSPMEDSPLDDFLSTPLMNDSSMLTSPAVIDSSNMFPDLDFADEPLFGSANDYSAQSISDCAPQQPLALPPSSFEGLYTMSPNTPALDPASLQSSPNMPMSDSMPPSSSPSVSRSASVSARRKSSPTGTRKNITPSALVPIEAPTQKRIYFGASATSRKEVPAVFARKRARSTAFGDEDEMMVEGDTSSLTMTEKEAIEAKRRQNTLAARRSRKRKLEYQRELEEGLEKEREEKQMWRNRALDLCRMLQERGIPVPTYE